MQQHRAKEYKGATKAYEVVLQHLPNRAAFHGLHAECLIRQARIKEACDAWNRSEKATSGTLLDFEKMLCDINGGFAPLRDRSRFRQQAAAGDVDAAENLVLLDSKFEQDWWNGGINAIYLKGDLEFLRQTMAGLKNDASKDGFAQVIAAGEIALSATKGPKEFREALLKHKLVLDEKRTLPARNELVSLLLGMVESAEVMTNAEMKSAWEQQILTRAKAAKSASLFNIVAHFNVKTDKLPEIQQEAWDATGGERFASALIAGLSLKKTLTLDDKRLQKALKDFPENTFIAEANLYCAVAEKKSVKEALIHAIQAEYTNLSIGWRFMQIRPSAKTLRLYFRMLTKELADDANKAK